MEYIQQSAKQQKPSRLRGVIIVSLLAFLVIYLGKWTTMLAMAWVFWKGAREFLYLASESGSSPLVLPSRIAVLACFIASAFSYEVLSVTVVSVILLLLLILTISAAWGKRDVTVNDISSTVYSVIYCGWLPAHFVLLRHLNGGDAYTATLLSDLINLFSINFSWINLGELLSNAIFESGFYYCALIAAAVSMNDIFAYIFGKLFGKTPLSTVSPKKTIEGSLGGLLIGTIFFAGTGIFNWKGYGLHYSSDNIENVLVFWGFGLFIAIVAQMGDLLESLMKRSANVKDSGQMIEGQGGILDRFDSHIVISALAFFFFKYYLG